jgi:RNA polymerase sigma-70 factor (ECF subfamily)
MAAITFDRGPAQTRSADVAATFDYDQWMLREQRRIFLLCLRMLRDSDEADMATQDSFLKAYKAFSQGGNHPLGKGGPEAIDDPSKWITRVAINTCYDRLRSRSWKFWSKRPKAEDEALHLAMAATRTPSPEDRARGSQIGRRLSEALEKLSPRQRSIFLLKHFEDRKLDEIGEILGLEVGTVKAHMARAVARLRVELKDCYGEGEA